MTDYIAALRRQRAHLKAIGADGAKLAENTANLLRAGVNPDELDKPKEEPKREAAPAVVVAPVGSKRRTTDAPTAPARTTASKLGQT